MTMTTLPLRITGGVDTHLEVHVAAALDHQGALLGVESFGTTPAGYRALHDWLSGFGELEQVGVEGTGSYGAGLTRSLHREGVRVVEVDRPNRQRRRRRGKSDPRQRECPLASEARSVPRGCRADPRCARSCAPDRHVGDAMAASSSRPSGTLARRAARQFCARGRQHSRSLPGGERYGGFDLAGASIAKAIDRERLNLELPGHVLVDCVKRGAQGGCTVHPSDCHMGDKDRGAIQCCGQHSGVQVVMERDEVVVATGYSREEPGVLAAGEAGEMYLNRSVVARDRVDMAEKRVGSDAVREDER
jgi:hypothetical protein